MARTWRNWSGSVVSRPRRWLKPPSEERLQEQLAAAATGDWPVRVVGAGHSSSGVVEVPGTLISLDQLRGVLSVDAENHQATVYAGTPLQELGRQLYDHDLTLPNFGDVATQTIGGAIGTATHGTGKRLRNLSQLMVKARVVTADGALREIGPDDPDALHALQVSMGTLGVITRVTLQLQPYFDVERREYAARTDDALEHFTELVEDNRSFDFYWYPRRDDVKLRLVNALGGGTARPAYGREVEHRAGHPFEVIPTHTGIPHHFEECEYALPIDGGLACFAQVRQRILQRWRHLVGWRVLVRTVSGDDAWLSPHHGRDSMTISLHQNSTLPWRDFFEDIEPVFQAFDGRPHWGKKHSMTAATLAPRYPQWARFAALRRRFDPDGLFMSPAMRALLGDDE